MKISRSVAIFSIFFMASTPSYAGVVSEKDASVAISAYNDKNYQIACNKFADLVANKDPVSIYYLGFDIDFNNGYCYPITKNLEIFGRFWWKIVEDRNLKDKINQPNSSILMDYISGEAAAKMIEVAANAGYGPAQTSLGRLYMRYKVDAYFPQDLNLAELWLKKGSESGSDVAEYLLGILAENGPIKGASAQHYIKAADRGHLYSMQISAINMYNGTNGFPNDKNRALVYLKILANQDRDIKLKKWADTFIQKLYQEKVYRN